MSLHVVEDGRDRRFSEKVSARLTAAAPAATGAGRLVYVAFVRMAADQRWENTVWAGRAQDESRSVVHRADRVLDLITVMSLGGAVAVLALIGTVRRCYAVTSVAVAVVGGSLALSEVLKSLVLRRPDLVGAPPRLGKTASPAGIRRSR